MSDKDEIIETELDEYWNGEQRIKDFEHWLLDNWDDLAYKYLKNDSDFQEWSYEQFQLSQVPY